MIMKIFKPLNLKGLGYNRFGYVITDKKAFIQSVAEREDISDLECLLDEAEDRDEMMDALEEALELRNKTEEFI